MKKLLTLLFVCTAVTLQAQNQQTRKVSKHTGISVSQAIVVDYIHSDRNEVIVDCANKDHLDLLLTDVKNGVLTIQYKPNTNINTKSPNKVTVYSNSKLESAKASSSGKLTIKDVIKTQSFELKASSSGKVNTALIEAKSIDIDASSSGDISSQIKADKVEIDASSSADIILSGKAESVEADMSSSADIDLKQVTIKDLSIDGSSSSSLTFDTAATVKSKLSSSAKAYYNVEPKSISQNITSSGGKLRKK